jgi:phosphatidylglycerophosphate synthase
MQMHQRAIQDATRFHKSILADVEKRFLIKIATLLPSKINSDHLTILGFAGMIGAGVSYWLASHNKYTLILAVIFLGINWFGDSLDGTLARVRNRLRPRYGFYVDHVVDALGALFLLGGLTLSPYISVGIAAGILIAYFLLSIEIYLATFALGVFKLSFWKWGPTELRILIAIGTLFLLYKTHVTIAGHKILLFDAGGICAIVAMIVIMLTSAIKNTIFLYKQEAA